MAWFDHWLKRQETGVLEGPRFRYVLPGAEGWRATDTWPVPGVVHRSLALRTDAILGDDEGKIGSRTLMALGAGLNRVQTSKADPSASLVWDSEPLARDLDVVGGIEVQLDAVSTAADTAWIAILQDVDAAGIVTNVTAVYLRAGLREVDEAASRPGAPDLPCRTFQAVPIGESLRYRIPLVANARRFRAGHRVRLFLTNDDQDPNTPALLTFRHASVGTSCLNTIRSSSRLVLPVMSGEVQ